MAINNEKQNISKISFKHIALSKGKTFWKLQLGPAFCGDSFTFNNKCIIKSGLF
jgi:hypothetical protein